MSKNIKFGVKAGAGPDPGYLWNVLILDLAFEDAMKFLNEAQYEYVAEQVRELAREEDPTHPSPALSVDAVENFHELREKGGVLGKINTRIYFTLDTREFGDSRNHDIVILGAAKKEAEGQMSEGMKIRIRRRLRQYLSGAYGRLPE